MKKKSRRQKLDEEILDSTQIGLILLERKAKEPFELLKKLQKIYEQKSKILKLNYSLFPSVHILDNKVDPQFGTISFDSKVLRSYSDLV